MRLQEAIKQTKALRVTLVLAGTLSAAWNGAVPGTHAQEKGRYNVDGPGSKVEIHVFKEGAFKMFGHDHLVAAKDISGEAHFDEQKIENARVSLKIATHSIRVVDPGESENDRQQVQATMEGPKVLDVKQFPEITFTSERVSAARKTAEGWELTVSGRLKLHGVEKTVSFPLRVHGDKGSVRGEGELSILQTDYGITPVKVGGGTVKVKDKLRINFTIVAKLAGQES